MKKQFALLLMLLLACQLPMLAQDSLPAHKSLTVYQFFSNFVTVENNFITDPVRNKPPWNHFIHAGTEEKLEVTGEVLKIDVFNKIPTGSFKQHYTGSWLKDTTAADSAAFALKDLQVSVSFNGQAANWKKVTSFPAFADPALYIKEEKRGIHGYHILNGNFDAGDSVMIELKNTTTGRLLFRLSIKRSSLPLYPFLAMLSHDSSARLNENDFIQGCMKTKDSVQRRLDSFYKDWPARYGANNNVFGISTYFPSSRLAFYFARTNAAVPDYSLEYKINATENTDTGWHKSGHLIMITRLQANGHYRLQVRYAAARENIWSTNFNVRPYWYQATGLRWTAAIIIFCLLAFTVFAFIYRQQIKRERSKKEALALELRSLRAQLNPHFIFNALGSIQGLMNNNQIPAANQYLSAFSALLRDSLKNHHKDFVSLAVELKMIETYISLEKLRFGFAYAIHVSSQLHASGIEIPSMLIQPLIENAVKHGIAQLNESGLLQLYFYENGKDLCIKITDNGKGFSAGAKQGFGLTLTHDRIKLLNQFSKEQQISFNIQANGGTTVILIFQNWLL